MDLDRKTIRYTIIFCGVSLLLSILTYGIKGSDFFALFLPLFNYLVKNGDTWFVYASSLFLGLFCSGVLVVLVAVISAQYKFKNSVNKILFYSKVVKAYYDRLPYSDKSRFIQISRKIVDCFTDFYKNYTEIEFLFFNRKYEKDIRALFIAFTDFTSPFNSAVIKDDIQVIEQKDVDFYYAESQTFAKLKFYEFIFKYVDLYTLWDKKLIASVMDADDLTQEIHDEKGMKHETIRQILAKRKQ
jgi:hypothetical protein